MIAELLYSLITYLLFAPNIVALRGPLSHQTLFLASSKWLVSLHLTPTVQCLLSSEYGVEKRVAGALVVPAHLQLPQIFKTYRTFVFFAYVFSHSLPAFGVTVNQGERRGASLPFHYDTPLSFSLLLPRHLLSARFLHVHAQGWIWFGAPVLFLLTLLVSYICSHSFSPLDGRDNGWLVFGRNHFKMGFAFVCFRAFRAGRGKFGGKVFKGGSEDLGKWGGRRMKGRILRYDRFRFFGNSRKIQLNCIFWILMGFGVVNVVCCSLALH